MSALVTLVLLAIVVEVALVTVVEGEIALAVGIVSVHYDLFYS